MVPFALPCFSSRTRDWSLSAWAASCVWGRSLEHTARGSCFSAAQRSSASWEPGACLIVLGSS